MFRRKDKHEPKPEPTYHVSQLCDDASGCKKPALLEHHVEWTVHNIGRVHQYYCQAHWEARQERKARKGTPALVEKGKKA